VSLYTSFITSAFSSSLVWTSKYHCFIFWDVLVVFGICTSAINCMGLSLFAQQGTGGNERHDDYDESAVNADRASGA
jgi:hypothetical protein